MLILVTKDEILILANLQGRCGRDGVESIESAPALDCLVFVCLCTRNYLDPDRESGCVATDQR